MTTAEIKKAAEDCLHEESILEVLRKWKSSWMNQTQNSEADRANYFTRAFGVDANMIHSAANRVSKSLMPVLAILTERDSGNLALAKSHAELYVKIAERDNGIKVLKNMIRKANVVWEKAERDFYLKNDELEKENQLHKTLNRKLAIK